MAQYKIVEITSVAFVAGKIGTPIAKAAYPVLAPARAVEKTNMIASAALIGRSYRDRSLPGSRYTEITFGVYLTNSPADQAPYWGPLLRACGAGETTAGTTPNIAALYKFSNNVHMIDEDTPGATDPIDIYFNEDGEERMLTNCVGNCVITFDSQGLPQVQFTFVGLVDDSVATATTSSAQEAAAAALTDPGQPVPSYGQGITVQIASATALSDLVIANWSCDWARNPQRPPDNNGAFGYGAPYLGGSSNPPTLKFRVLRRELTLYDWWGAFLNGDLITFKGLHNATGGVGKTVKYGFRGRIGSDPEPVEAEGRLAYDLTLHQDSTSGNEFFIGVQSTADHTYPF